MNGDTGALPGTVRKWTSHNATVWRVLKCRGGRLALDQKTAQVSSVTVGAVSVACVGAKKLRGAHDKDGCTIGEFSGSLFRQEWECIWVVGQLPTLINTTLLITLTQWWNVPVPIQSDKAPAPTGHGGRGGVAEWFEEHKILLETYAFPVNRSRPSRTLMEQTESTLH